MDVRVEVLGQDQTVHWKQFAWDAVPRVNDVVELDRDVVAPVVDVGWLPVASGRVRVRVDGRALDPATLTRVTDGWGRYN